MCPSSCSGEYAVSPNLLLKIIPFLFFKNALPKETERLGIVYTPVEVVDFIIRSVEYVMQQRFGHSISDMGVHVLDPFTGTGTFIVRLLRRGIIKPEDLLYKYTSEIHCNEIVLLAYYIAAVNIEETYHELSQSENYVPFEGIVLTDTFELAERVGTREGEADSSMPYFGSNRAVLGRCGFRERNHHHPA